MADKQDPEVRELKKIERQVSEIRHRTGSPWRAFLNGLLYGAGWVIGGIATIIFLSWILSLLGVIPGFDKIAAYLSSVIQYWHGTK